VRCREVDGFRAGLVLRLLNYSPENPCQKERVFQQHGITVGIGIGIVAPS